MQWKHKSSCSTLYASNGRPLAVGARTGPNEWTLELFDDVHVGENDTIEGDYECTYESFDEMQLAAIAIARLRGFV